MQLLKNSKELWLSKGIGILFSYRESLGGVSRMGMVVAALSMVPSASWSKMAAECQSSENILGWKKGK